MEIEKVKGGYRVGDNPDPFISVTTVLGRLNKPALLGWYGKHGNNEARKILKESQEIGIWLDSYTDSYFEKTEWGNGKAEREKYGNVLRGFHQFAEKHKLEDVMIDGSPAKQITVFSEELKVAGTFDRLIKADGNLVLLDWKTSGAVWDEYWIQLQVYYWLLRYNTQYGDVNYDLQEIIKMQERHSLWICRFDKQGDFDYTKDIVKMKPDIRIFKEFKKLVDWCVFEKYDFKKIKKEIKEDAK